MSRVQPDMAGNASWKLTVAMDPLADKLISCLTYTTPKNYSTGCDSAVQYLFLWFSSDVLLSTKTSNNWKYFCSWKSSSMAARHLRSLSTSILLAKKSCCLPLCMEGPSSFCLSTMLWKSLKPTFTPSPWRGTRLFLKSTIPVTKVMGRACQHA